MPDAELTRTSALGREPKPGRSGASLAGHRALGLISERFWLVAAVYFALQAAIRIVVSPELGMDDAEQVLLAQSWAWGYGSQPPLYTWLQMGLFAFIGQGLAAVVILKNALLFTTYVAVHAVARRVLRDRLAALAAVLSLLFIPQIAWESQRALSHTVLAVAIAACATLVLLRLIEKRRTLDYALWGVLLAAGFLSKLNFVYFAAALLMAALSVPACRQALTDRRMLGALVLAAALVAPTVGWMAFNPELVAQRIGKFALSAGSTPIETLALGLGSFAASTLAFLAPLLVIHALAAARTSRGEASADAVLQTVLGRALVFGLVLIVITVVFSGATTVKDRWLQPILFLAPVFTIAALQARLPPARLAAVVWLAMGAALVVMVAVPTRVLLAGGDGKTPSENRPLSLLAGQIEEQLGFTRGTIIAPDHATGGNLALRFPQATTLIPEYRRLDAPVSTPVLLVWSEDTAEPPPAMAETYALRFGHPLPQAAAVTLSAPRHYGSGDMETLRVMLVGAP